MRSRASTASESKNFARHLMSEAASVAVVGSGRKSAGQASRLAARFSVSDARSPLANVR